MRETHPLRLPVHAAQIKSSISSVNKSTRAGRFCWSNSCVTNRKQLVQPICRKIQRPCQRKSCWKWCFHPSQIIVSQAKVLLLLLPYQLPDVTTAVSAQMPWPKSTSWRLSNKKAESWSTSSYKNKQSRSRWTCLQMDKKNNSEYCLSSIELYWSLFQHCKDLNLQIQWMFFPPSISLSRLLALWGSWSLHC